MGFDESYYPMPAAPNSDYLDSMSKNRLEAFSDGVIAIIITIMVLELKVPHDPTLAALLDLAPVFGSYVLSFVFIGIYWNNHHHLLHAVRSVSGASLWANLHLLFWLSLVPFAAGWMGENHFAQLPVALYGLVLLMAGAGYFILTRTLIAHHGGDSKLATAVGGDIKGLRPGNSTAPPAPGPGLPPGRPATGPPERPRRDCRRRGGSDSLVCRHEHP